jgi:hypothetical protein
LFSLENLLLFHKVNQGLSTKILAKLESLWENT